MNKRSTRRLDRFLLVALVLVAVLSVGVKQVAAGPYVPPPDFEVYQFNFDKSTEPWVGSMYVDGPRMPRNDYPGMLQPILMLGGDEKNRYALLNSNGADGVWMYASFLASQRHLAFSFDVANVENAGRLAPILFVGKGLPETVYQFEKAGYPLEKGSQTLNKYVDLKEAGLQGEKINIAIGFLNLDRERIAQSALIDNVRILLHNGD